MSFSHEKLKVYQRSLGFIEYVNQLISSNSTKLNVFDQLVRAATSISLNIAEGTGKYTSKDKCRYYDIARGSALECAACLDVLLKKEKITKEISEEGKSTLFEIVSMLTGLIRSTSDRVYEPELDYKIGNDDTE